MTLLNTAELIMFWDDEDLLPCEQLVAEFTGDVTPEDIMEHFIHVDGYRDNNIAKHLLDGKCIHFNTPDTEIWFELHQWESTETVVLH